MKNRLLAATAFVCLFTASASAQTATGTGVGVSESNSAAGALAVNRGNGGNSSLTVNNPASTTSTVDQRTSGTTTSNINQRVSGTQSLKTVPSMVAPSLTAAGLETCLGSASGTVSFLGTGLGGGSTFVDPGCEARLDSRTLASYGLKAAAVARLCARPDIWRSMPDICQQYWPAGVPLPYGIAYAYGAAPVVGVGVAVGPGPMRVVDGRDGLEKDCLNYNAARRRCNHWAGEPPRHYRVASTAHHHKQHLAAKPKPATAVVAKPITEPTSVKKIEPKEGENRT